MPSATSPPAMSLNISREISQSDFTMVEHPGIIRNIDNCVASLGGDHKIGQFLHSKNPEKYLGFLLRPEDAFRKHIRSQLVETQNVVLKVNIPKRTGRKRKRGSNEPYQFDDEEVKASKTPAYKEARRQLRAIQDNPGTCHIEVAGTIGETYRFRTLPDFQFALMHNSMAQDFRKHILPFKYDDLKNFSLNFKEEFTRPEMEMFPPPTFAQLDIPFNYQYLQNPYVKFTTNATGNQTSVNNYGPRKIFSTIVKPSQKGVPMTPNPLNCPETQLAPKIKAVIATLRRLFEDRPIMTRRVILNNTTREIEYDLKIALPYVSYICRSGPWRDSFIRLGYDPRLSPTSRMYQTITFKIQTLKKADEAPAPFSRSTPAAPSPALAQTPNKDGATPIATLAAGDEQAATPGTVPTASGTAKPTPTPSRSRYSRVIRKAPLSTPSDSHIFTGKGPLHSDAKVWQLCDITAPLLRGIIDDAPPPETCATISGGWMQPLALAKVRVIMRDMITVLLAGGTPLDEDYERLAGLSDGKEGGADNDFDPTKLKNMGQKDRELAFAIRQEAKMYGKGKGLEDEAGEEGGDNAGDAEVDPALLEGEDEGEEGSDADDDEMEEA